MEITLSRPLTIHCFEVFAEIAKGERRQEIQAVLLLAEENGGRLTSEEVCRDLLGGRPPVVGRTILRRCREYGLMEGSDEESFLTEAGRESAMKGMVFISEKGKYRLWVTDDPLFTAAALDLAPVREEALSTDHVRESHQAHARGGDSARRLSNGSAVDMKGQADALRGRVFTPLKSGSQPYRINFVGPEWVRVEDPEAHPVARITWTTSDSSAGNVRVDGAYRADGLAPPRVPFHKIWSALLGPFSRDWVEMEDGTYLRCAFDGDGLTDASRRAFRRTLEFATPSVPELGEFDALEVEDVSIAPRERQDAQAWAEWLLQDSITSYQDGKSFGVLQQEVLRAFPDFEVALPSMIQTLERIRHRVSRGDDGRLPAAFWYLQTPRDLIEGGSPATNRDSGEDGTNAAGHAGRSVRGREGGYRGL